MEHVAEELIPTRTTLLLRLKDWQDRSGWQDFFDTYWNLIYGVALKGGLNPTEAEDVVQETMIRAWKAQDSLLDEAAAKPWFLTIIRREYARTFERKRFVTVDVEELIAKEEPMLAAADDQELVELRTAIFKLPSEYREPLVMQVLMGYSTAEIAAELELSNAAVLTRLFRARKQLRAMCGEDTSLDPEE